MKKLFKYGCLSVVGFFIVIGVLGFVFGNSSTNDSIAQNTAASEAQSGASTDGGELAGNAAEEPAAELEPTSVPGVGQDVIVDEVRWHILSAEDLGSVLQDDNQFTEDLTTRGKFIQVRFEIENLSSDMISFGGADLVDDQGREFSAASDAFAYIPDSEASVVLSNLNPNVPETITMIYEVPADASGLMFRAGDLEMFGNAEKLIALDL